MNEDTKEQKVRRVIRRKGTLDYFNGEGWTQKLQEAWSFSDSLEAAQTCANHDLRDVELALLVEGQTPHEVFCTGIR